MAAIQDLFITVGISANPKGDPAKVLYVGLDALRAQDAYSKAGQEFAEVGVIAHPQVVFPRRPQEEARLSVEQKEAEARRQSAEADRKLKLAEDKEAEAGRLLKESEQIKGELTATQKRKE